MGQRRLKPTQRCSLRVGNATLDYAFTPTESVGGTVEAFTRSGAQVFYAHSLQMRRFVKMIQRGELRRPRNVDRVVTSFAADSYEGLYVAMWLLGRRPVVPHRSRTYRTGVLVNGKNQERGWFIWHRFPFSDGRLTQGLTDLLRTIYNVTPEHVTA